MTTYVLPTRAAVFALPAGPVEPGDADAIADAVLGCLRAQGIDGADDLVARRYRQPIRFESTFHRVQIGMT